MVDKREIDRMPTKHEPQPLAVEDASIRCAVKLLNFLWAELISELI